MKKLFIAMLLFAALADARTIAVSDFNDSVVFEQGNARYRILTVEQLQGADKTFTIYIVENVSAIERNEQLLAALSEDGKRLEAEHKNVLLLTSDAISLKREDETALGTLKKQQVYYTDVLDSLAANRKDVEQKTKDLEGRHAQLSEQEQELGQKLTSNVVLSPTNYGIGLLVFIMLITGAIMFQRKELMLLKGSLKIRRVRHKGEVALVPEKKKDGTE